MKIKNRCRKSKTKSHLLLEDLDGWEKEGRLGEWTDWNQHHLGGGRERRKRFWDEVTVRITKMIG